MCFPSSFISLLVHDLPKCWETCSMCSVWVLPNSLHPLRRDISLLSVNRKSSRAIQCRSPSVFSKKINPLEMASSASYETATLRSVLFEIHRYRTYRIRVQQNSGRRSSCVSGVGDLLLLLQIFRVQNHKAKGSMFLLLQHWSKAKVHRVADIVLTCPVNQCIKATC